ncbi:DUF2804 domain-containing protein [Shewanella mangrovi]|uniref:DUF2804 family protein n=1 Tax=Shewanella mangrovi TaxID=1515746 RepID=UPI000AE2EFD1|nr:DUF2804 family protein [Shewanella mangrovi]
MTELNPSSTFKQRTITRMAPEQLFTAGEPNFGYFDGPVKQLTAPGASFSLGTQWRLRLKRQLEIVMLQHRQFQLLCRVAAPLQAPQILLFDHVKQQVRDISPRRFFKGRATLSSNAWQGMSSAGELKLAKFQGHWQLQLAAAAAKLPLSLNAELRPTPLSLPVSCCGALRPQGWVYQQQHHGLAPVGEFMLNFEPQVLSRMTAGYGYFVGQSSRQTPWRWLIFNGDVNGRRAGMCLTDGLSATFPGNGLWLDGARHILPSVQLTVEQRGRRLRQWRILSACGCVEGVFTPKIELAAKSVGWLPTQTPQLLSGQLDLDVIDCAGQHLEIRNLPAIIGSER